MFQIGRVLLLNTHAKRSDTVDTPRRFQFSAGNRRHDILAYALRLRENCFSENDVYEAYTNSMFGAPGHPPVVGVEINNRDERERYFSHLFPPQDYSSQLRTCREIIQDIKVR